MTWLILLVVYILYKVVSSWINKSRFVPPKPGTTVLVTGGCQGLGRQIALLYAKVGCRIVIWDIEDRLFSSIKSEIEVFRTSVVLQCVNVGDLNQVKDAAARLRSEGIKVDILVNNAGVAGCKTVSDLTEAEIRRTMNVNYFGMVWTTQVFLPEVSQICYVASVCSHFASVAGSEYCASKAAIHNFIQCLRQELKSNKSPITLTALYPYHINTRLFQGFKPASIIEKLFPSLKEEDVAMTLFAAVGARREEVFLPSFAKEVTVLLQALPTSMRDWLCINLFGRSLQHVNPVNYKF